MTQEEIDEGWRPLREALARDDGKAAADLLSEVFADGLAAHLKEKADDLRRKRRRHLATAARFAAVQPSARAADLYGLGADDLIDALMSRAKELAG